ncbi:putative exported protein [Pantoea sp. AS-PWVM4]|uniref:alginate lyase family protein n=1 Tax=Pantoea sp. AS-PWVM4 TaxID=1332069 RepID=UPI0003AC89BE|nr:alginate lyase family protein [Pantoea sp. AS-PWVM4]ERK12311.1 putative exported protein [Pantoea sp. AS-PWVM4]
MKRAGILAFALWLCSGFGQATELAFLSLSDLQQVKQQLAQHRAASPTLAAWQQLQREAQQALKHPDPSVIDKGLLPPGGSKHDYLSLSAYWWPDASQPAGLPWLRRDGVVNPASKNDQSDGVRLARFSADVQALTLAWYFSGEQRYADKAQSLVRHWFIDPASRMNPNLNFAQGVPGIADGRHTGVLDGRYFATRVVDALQLLRTSPGWQAADQQGVERWFRDYLHWLQHSPLAQQEAAAPNNHGSWYCTQLAGIAWYLGDNAAVRAMVTLARGKIDQQIRADGSQPYELARTRSFHYSYFNLQALTALAQLAQKSGNGDLWHYQNAQGGSLLAALAALAPYSDPVKPWPWKNRDRVSQRIIPLLSLADNSLHQTRWESAIARTDWTAFSGSARGAVEQAQRDTWLISLPYGQKKGQQ